MLRYLLVLSYLLLTSCFVVESSDDGNSSSSSICVDAEPVTTNAIQVTFRFPRDAENVEILRNGIMVYSTTNSQATTFIDTPLEEGITYTYSCRMMDSFGDLIFDRNQITAETDSSTAPNFAGINSTAVETDTSAYARWLSPAQGVLPRSFNVYFGFSDSASEVFEKAPLASVEGAATRQLLLTNLGDGLTYYLGARACSASGNCDSNEVLRTVTMPDRGAPQTIGATAVELQNDGGNTIVRITAPWDHTLGQVTVRQIYHARIAYQTACPTTLNLYTAANGVPFDPSNPAISIQPLVGAINQNETHCFIVRDRDSLGQENQNLNVVKIDVGDITPPDTNPIQLYLTRSVTHPENRLVATWTAIQNETENALSGASVYRLYVSSAPYPAMPNSDPCTNGTLRTEINASFYSSGQSVSYTIDSLTPRTNYRVCLKVADSSSNTGLVLGKHNILESTGDVTPPVFFGITSATLNVQTVGLDIGFNLSTSADIHEYRIKVVKIPSMQTIEVIKPKPLQASGTYIMQATLAELQLLDNDVADIYVNACDNALTFGFNTINNCTDTVAKVQVTIPDTVPPQGFSGIISAVPGSVDRSITVSWSPPSNWQDYAGFNVFYVNSSSQLVALDSTSCACTAGNCQASPVTSCTVTREEGGTLLTPSRQYEMYVSAYDLTGNQTTQYIQYTGGSKITAVARARDLENPIFNANFDPLAYTGGGIKIKFSAATDTQDNTLQIRYEFYRRLNSTFICPLTPNVSTGGCDNLTPIATVNGSALTPETGKFFYTDTAVTDGNTYYYQVCALDYANNRSCQQGSIPSLAVTDVTLPVISNLDSNKMWAASGNTSWQITFNPTDNIATPEQLIIRVYRSTTAYPSQSSPGVPTFTTTGGTVTVAGGVASFTDTGAANTEVYYYLIEVQDLAGNKAFATIRDMLPAATITSVQWPDPLIAGGHPDILGNALNTPLAQKNIRITGTNLTTIQQINEVGSGAFEADIRVCTTSRIASQTETLLVCNMASNQVYWGGNHNLYTRDKHGRTITYNVGSPVQYCAWAAANGITDIRGAGTAAAPFVICTPTQFTQINTNVSGTNIRGHIYIGADINMSGVTGFTGIPVFNAGEMFINGNPNLNSARTIRNLTIDTTLTNQDAAIFRGCTGSTSENKAFVNTLNFDNITVRTGTGKGAILIANKDCLFSSASINSLNNIRITNSNVYSNNTAGFIAAEFATENEGVNFIDVEYSKIYSTRVDSTSAVGGFAGILKGNSTPIPVFTALQFRGNQLLPAVGQSNSGDRIGGLFGSMTLSRLNLQNSYFRHGNVAADRGLISAAGSKVGGLIGNVASTVSYLRIYNSEVEYLDIDNLGALTKIQRGGFFGYIDALPGGAQVLLEQVDVFEINISGQAELGGFIGYALGARSIIMNGTNNLGRFNITATGDRVGGVVGYFHTGLLNISNLITNNSSGSNSLQGANYVGGFVGFSNQTTDLQIRNSRVTRTNINGTGYLGGFIGGNSRTHVYIYQSGVHEVQVLGTGSNIGGMVGQHYNNNAFSWTFHVEQCGVGETYIRGISSIGGIAGSLMNSGQIDLLDNYIGMGFSGLTSPIVEGQNSVGGLVGGFENRNDVVTNWVLTARRNAVNGVIYVPSGGSNVGTVFGQYQVPMNTTITVLDNYFRNDYTGLGRLTSNTVFSYPGQIDGINATQAANISTYVNWDINPLGNYSGVWFLDNVNAYGFKARLSTFNTISAQYGL